MGDHCLTSPHKKNNQQVLRRRLEEAEARASSSEEAVRRLASEVWALRRQVALLSGAEKEGDSKGEDGNGGGTYYDVIRVVGDGAPGGMLGGMGGKEPPPLASVAAAEAEAALMPLPKINPALFIAEGDIVVGPRVRCFGGDWVSVCWDVRINVFT